MAKPVLAIVTDPVDIDLSAFSLWLKGIDVQNATSYRLSRESAITVKFADHADLLLNETEEMYRLFNSMEAFLQSPPMFLSQYVFQVPLGVRSKMIEMYYTYDEPVVREFIGKKLSGRDRRELDEVSERTRVSMRSCRRQFDNIKRVLKVVDDLNGSLVENIKSQFLLSDSLSQCYAGLVFLSCNKFETGKKRLAHITVQDFIHCATLIIESWTSGSAESTRQDDIDLELDKYFLQELHDMKIHLYDRAFIDTYQKLVLRDLRKKHPPSWMMKTVESNFGILSRNLTSIGSSLIHSKDLKDLFVDIQEKIIEPSRQLKWSKEDMNIVLTSMVDTLHDCESSLLGQYGKYFTKDKKKWRVEPYLRYLNVLKQTIYVLYH